MDKCEFFARLREGLSGLPREDIEERLAFYGEMIDDRMEEGLSEEEAIATMDPIEVIVAQAIGEIPLVRLAKESIKQKRRLTGWEITLLAIGSPIWLSLGIAAVAVALSLYIFLWSVIVSFWSVFGSLAACAFGGLVAGIIFACSSNVPTGIAIIAAGLICTGLSVFAFFGCKAATKGTMALTKKMVIRAKNCFIKKEGA